MAVCYVVFVGLFLTIIKKIDVNLLRLTARVNNWRLGVTSLFCY